MNIHSLKTEAMSDSQPDTLPAAPPDPKEAREAEILNSIRKTFIEKGFDGASMQDLARAAGMSVGNFYRYFSSKAAMVEALIRLDLAEVEAKFAMILAADDPFEALRFGLHERISEEVAVCEDGALWCEIHAAAARKPEIAAVVFGMEDEIVCYLNHAFALITGLSEADCRERFGAHARVAIMMVKAVAMQKKGGKPVTDGAAVGALVQRIVDAILDEVAAARAKG
ncbi:TetR/AcrR family transcriptional regulator [Gemmobacter serpentinus]|uniref:TetR/AcrR family transcriptional regulator n=1 Tax=Gemmobacter serpentinus TaxID=2652247 RepID=UPI001CF6A8BF|nr:TetR/AcrR family transcriptional regulator [Gemmobacter serpentinus]